MRQYYRLMLNCSRVNEYASYIGDSGFISVFPEKGYVEKKSFLGTKRIPTTVYTGNCYVVAEKCDDCFKDIVLGKRIDFDPGGVKNIYKASLEDLEEELEKGLTCYSCVEVEPVVAMFQLGKIVGNPTALEKYKSELYEIESKSNVKSEIERRLVSETTETSVENKPKKRVLSRRSA